jgi:lysophospholipase L1-like esterase
MTAIDGGWLARGIAAATLLALSPLPASAEESKARVVTLGDSITRGVRAGVKPEETFTALLEKGLRGRGLDAEVVNVGIGGERTGRPTRRSSAWPGR